MVGDEFVIAELKLAEGELGGGGELAILERTEGNRHGALGRSELVEDQLDGSDAEVVGGFHHERDEVGGGGADVLAGLGEVDLRRFIAEGTDGVGRTVEAGASAAVGEDDGVGVVVGDRKIGGPELVGEVAQGKGGAVGELQGRAAEGNVGVDTEHGAGAAEGGDGRSLLFGDREAGVGRRGQPDGEVADLGWREGGEGELGGNGVPGGDPPAQRLGDAEAVGGGAVGEDGERRRLPGAGACGEELELGLGRDASGEAVGQGEIGADGELAVAEAGLDAGEAGLGPGRGGPQQRRGAAGSEERKSEHGRQRSGERESNRQDEPTCVGNGRGREVGCRAGLEGGGDLGFVFLRGLASTGEVFGGGGDLASELRAGGLDIAGGFLESGGFAAHPGDADCPGDEGGDPKGQPDPAGGRREGNGEIEDGEREQDRDDGRERCEQGAVASGAVLLADGGFELVARGFR